MKKLALMLACTMALMLAGVTGCSSKAKVDTGLVETSFAEASAEDKAKIQQVVDAVKAGNFAAALEQVQELQFDLEMTPSQEGALLDLLLQLETKVGAGK